MDMSDYLTKEELEQFKKPAKNKKSKKSKRLRQASTNDFPDDVAQPVTMQFETNAPTVKKSKVSSVENFVDDEDLQMALTLARRSAIQNKKIDILKEGTLNIFFLL